MADTQVIDWDQISADEEITEADQAASNELSTTTPVGKFLCTIMESEATEKQMTGYGCYAANLKMRIDKVLKIEKPIFDDQNKQVIRNGEVVMKVQDVSIAESAKVNTLHTGKFIFDDVNLYHPKEKETWKKRRLFIAKKIGLIDARSTALKSSEWAGAKDRQVIVNTVWNQWKDKDTGEARKNVKVDFWAGYEKATDTSFNTEDFDI